MPYTAQINRAHPTCVVFLVDQSGSMEKPMTAGAGITKSQAVADCVNRLLQNLILKCAREEGVRRFLDIGVIGYGGKPSRAGPAFTGPLAGRDLVPIHEVADNPARIEDRPKQVSDGAGGLVELRVKFPIWFDPVHAGETPMCAALARAKGVLSDFVSRHPASFPPIVINITDGEATDGDPRREAAQLRDLATADGHLLLFNIHVSAQPGVPVEFPSSPAVLPDQHAVLLFEMSSVLPDAIRQAARQSETSVSDGSRGFAYGADLVSLVKFLDIGTRVEFASGT